MAEKIISVKCEMNEKNKAAIKSALCDALLIGDEFWHGDIVETAVDRTGLMKYKIKICESLAANGYKILVSFEKTNRDDFWAAMVQLISGIVVLAFLGCIIFFLDAYNLFHFFDGIRVEWKKPLCRIAILFCLWIVGASLLGKVWSYDRLVKKRIDSVATWLNM